MLDNTKIYFLYLLFLNLNEKNKLKLLKYNKILQDKLGIKLINYKIFSGRYIIYQMNGKGKEFNIYNHKIVFEGEYLNGKRNGKGKEYDIFGHVIFEGEYLNGKRWNGSLQDANSHYAYDIIKGNGLVREYNYFGRLKFEGNYFNGERNGYGKEFDDSGYLIFEGEFLKGKKWNSSDMKYFLYGLKNGKGLIKERIGSLNVQCQYIDGEKNGKGEGYYFMKKAFEVEYKNGKKNGKGKEFYDNGGLSFEGEYYYDYKIRGREYYLNGKLGYEGEYFNDKKWNGKGYDEKGNIIYELINGNGSVKEYKKISHLLSDNKVLIFEGKYLNAERNGQGKEYNAKGILYGMENKGI